MSEDLKTIKELADEIGVSKQAVWQKNKKRIVNRFTSIYVKKRKYRLR